MINYYLYKKSNSIAIYGFSLLMNLERGENKATLLMWYLTPLRGFKNFRDLLGVPHFPRMHLRFLKLDSYSIYNGVVLGRLNSSIYLMLRSFKTSFLKDLFPRYCHKIEYALRYCGNPFGLAFLMANEDLLPIYVCFFLDSLRDFWVTS